MQVTAELSCLSNCQILSSDMRSCCKHTVFKLDAADSFGLVEVLLLCTADMNLQLLQLSLLLAAFGCTSNSLCSCTGLKESWHYTMHGCSLLQAALTTTLTAKT
jgi:hypothetical protein